MLTASLRLALVNCNLVTLMKNTLNKLKVTVIIVLLISCVHVTTILLDTGSHLILEKIFRSFVFI